MAMFTLPQMISRLTKGFVKFTGRMPDGLEKIKIKQEALERIKQQDKVVDMEGNVIDTSKGIMGGRQADKFISQNKTMIDEAIDNASPGFAGDVKYDAQLVADDLAEKRFGKDFSDLDQKQQMDLYDQAYTGLSKQRFKGMKKPKDDPEEKAMGGRIGLKAGMNRRAFLKLMGGVGAGIGALKTGLLKLAGKGAASQAAKEIIKTPSAAGKPEWFDALVTKVINQGEDVTKRFATKDREVVHLAKIDDDATVTVYRDLDTGTVRVDVSDATKNVADDQGEAIVSMEVRGGQLEEGVKGKTPAEFEAVEADYRNYTTSPDGDYDTEVVENVVNNTKDLTADLTKLKIYARGDNKPTMKEFVESKKRQTKLEQAAKDPADYASDRGPQYDPPDPEPDDFASGGLAGMLGE
jgi:hypothetical protein